MTGPSDNDLHRDMGRMEATLDALEKAMTKGFEEMNAKLSKIDTDVQALKNAESQRKGAFSLGQWIVGAIGAGIALIVEHFWK